MLPEDLQSMKYVELQKLAKSAGIRANQKIDKLVKALTEHFDNSNEIQTTNEEAEQVTDVTMDDSDGKADSGNTPKEIQKTGSKNKKRKRTFELEEPTLSGDSTPVIENDQPRVTRLRTSRNNTPQSEISENQPVKRMRRSTYDKQSPSIQGNDKHSDGSPSTRAILDSINGDCSSAERREKLLSAIDKKVQLKMVSSPSNPTKNQPSQIPRFMAFLTNKKKDTQNSSTPGSKSWNKIHKKEFAKFDSIDVYLEKKQTRKENLSASTKKQLAKQSPAVNPSSRAAKLPSIEQDSSKIFKPTVMSAKNINFDFSKSLSNSSKMPRAKVLKPSVKDSSKIFKPTVMSTKNINFEFSKAVTAPSNTPKSRAVNTPSRKQALTSTKLTSTKKATHTTPFKFTGNSSMLNTTVTLPSSVTSSKKQTFDLKASLAKPLTWKPHTGKLQCVDVNAKPNAPVSRSSANVTSHRVRKVLSRDSANKKRPAQAKNVRRAAQLDRRSNQKYIDMMKRRGLMA